MTGLLPSNDAPVNRRLEPRRASHLGRRKRSPFRANEVEIDIIAVGSKQGLDIDLVLRPKGNHLGQDQPRCRGDRDRVALRPFH